ARGHRARYRTQLHRARPPDRGPGRSGRPAQGRRGRRNHPASRRRTPVTSPKFARGQLNTYQTPDAAGRVASALHAVGTQLARVPTMGALHAGHRELLRRAKRLQGTVVAASIFVNPLQFGEGEDFEAYPRPIERDLAALGEIGAELAFVP